MINSNSLYSAWLFEWLQVYKKNIVKNSTLEGLQTYIRLHIPDWLKDLPLSQITPFHLQKALNLVPTSRNRLFVYDIYSETFRRAFQLEFIPKNPMLAVDKVKHTRKQGQALNKLQIQTLLIKTASPRLKTLFLFYLYTGVRRSEALSLRWSDINFEKSLITVKGTKTLKAFRTIPLFKPLLELLKTLPRENDFVFNYSAEYVSRKFHKICPTNKLHDLRHTFATRCLECGISIKVVQAWLGHTRLDTTANIYTHILDDFNRIEADKFKLL